MDIEVVAFYPHAHDETRQTLSGTLHVYLVEHDIDLRGIFVSRRKDSWFFSLPNRQAIDAETGETIRYPCITFKSRERQKELIDAIREKGRAYIEVWLGNTENPRISPQESQQSTKAGTPTKRVSVATSTKETAVVANPKQAQPKSKEYRDPPKQAFKKSVTYG